MGGKAIIALPSITKRGESRIVPYLKQGAGVVSTRANVQYIITENGIANLYGKTLKQRVSEMVKIAHPTHQESIERAYYEIDKNVKRLTLYYSREFPVITAGFSIPINSKIVGARSPKTPSCMVLNSLSTKIIGTGLVV